MSITKICNIYAGIPDAKEDIRYETRDFISVFTIPPRQNFNDLFQGNKCFILGNKGLGKTAVLRYIDHEVRAKNPISKTSFILFEQNYASHQNEVSIASSRQSFTTYDVDEGGAEVEDYTYFWRWHFFMTILRDNEVDQNEQIFVHNDSWKAFSETVSAALKKDSKQVRISSSLNFGFNLFGIINPEISIKLPELSIGRKNSTFQEVVEKATYCFRKLERLDVPYYIFVDELDVCHTGNENRYKRDLRLVRDLLLTIRWFNDQKNDMHWSHIKAFGTSRPEVLKAIEDHYGNRVRNIMEGFSFTLKWDFNTSEMFEVPIIQLLMRQIEKAEEINGEYGGTDATRYTRWFPERINGLEPTRYIRSITWSRPRDIVRLLDCCVNARGFDTCFTEDVFQAIISEYSNGSCQEAKAELEASYIRKDVDEIFDCFYGLPRRFTWLQFAEYTKDSRVIKDKGVDRILGDLFRVGVIGQVVGDDERWYHYGDEYNSRGVNIVHAGLVRKLGVIWKNETETIKKRELTRYIQKLANTDAEEYMKGEWLEDAWKFWEKDYDERIGRSLLVYYMQKIKEGDRSSQNKAQELFEVLSSMSRTEEKTDNLLKFIRPLFLGN